MLTLSDFARHVKFAVYDSAHSSRMQQDWIIEALQSIGLNLEAKSLATHRVDVFQTTMSVQRPLV
jgi:hypothetical protein